MPWFWRSRAIGDTRFGRVDFLGERGRVTQLDPATQAVEAPAPRKSRQLTFRVSGETATRIEALLASQPVRPSEGELLRMIVAAGLPRVEAALLHNLPDDGTSAADPEDAS
jgi:hypothetical protein